MKTVIVIANPKENSFNHAIADAIIEGLKIKNKEFKIWDLNKMNFKPVLSSEEFEKFGYGSVCPDLQNFLNVLIKECDQIIFIYPLFYFDFPAILKGFFDRLFIGTLIKDGLEPVN
ncbi:NAD(P)H-dependent oxidoreductase [Spiroplasma taiwanense]|uniref:NAD(P)H-dependent oxidoreductase n=1 Tax=Spiroplasma taiwanense TaxID=2145 RepID=UPI000407121E|nr:NAD(P)H-dependent oxidoreductase [Spiroplasma taiwanense]